MNLIKNKIIEKIELEKIELEEIPIGLAKPKKILFELIKENKEKLCPKLIQVSLKKIM